jgi:hypothetical protein
MTKGVRLSFPPSATIIPVMGGVLRCVASRRGHRIAGADQGHLDRSRTGSANTLPTSCCGVVHSGAALSPVRQPPRASTPLSPGLFRATPRRGGDPGVPSR